LGRVNPIANASRARCTAALVAREVQFRFADGGSGCDNRERPRRWLAPGS
jgi:hypothetical protein